MPALRVRVNQQRWDAPTQRFQAPGEIVEIVIDDPAAFARRCQLYHFTCTPLDGAPWPGLEPGSNWFESVKEKAKTIMGKVTGREFRSLEELENPPVLKQTPKGWICPECSKRYKTEGGLLKHLKHSGHKVEVLPE